MEKEFIQKIKEAISKLREWKKKQNQVLIIFHDDGDGVTSGAICKRALEREGFKTNEFCIEKLLPEIIERIHRERGKIIFYADLASAHAKKISQINKGKNLVIILDHHDAEKSDDPLVININPELFDMRGEDTSGSSVCYLFARELNGENKDLAKIALIGLKEIPKPKGKISELIIKEAGEIKGVDTLHKNLTILASTGYYQKGPELGIKVCLEGMNDEIKERINELEDRRKRANRELLAELKLITTPNLQYFDSGDYFKGMGVKVIGTFCSYLSYQRRMISQKKYILGFMRMERDIPGFGELKNELTKVSIRVPEELNKKIVKKEAMSCVGLLRKACEKIGGVADGHEFAASGTITRGKEKELINELERILRG